MRASRQPDYQQDCTLIIRALAHFGYLTVDHVGQLVAPALKFESRLNTAQRLLDQMQKQRLVRWAMSSKQTRAYLLANAGRGAVRRLLGYIKPSRQVPQVIEGEQFLHRQIGVSYLVGRFAEAQGQPAIVLPEYLFKGYKLPRALRDDLDRRTRDNTLDQGRDAHAKCSDGWVLHQIRRAQHTDRHGKVLGEYHACRRLEWVEAEQSTKSLAEIARALRVAYGLGSHEFLDMGGYRGVNELRIETSSVTFVLADNKAYEHLPKIRKAVNRLDRSNGSPAWHEFRQRLRIVIVWQKTTAALIRDPSPPMSLAEAEKLVASWPKPPDGSERIPAKRVRRPKPLPFVPPTDLFRVGLDYLV
jgi:hypothetical protein